jgi:hypothetical protein
MLLYVPLHIIFCVYTEIALNALFIIVHYFFLAQTIQWNKHTHKKNIVLDHCSTKRVLSLYENLWNEMAV